MVLQLSMRYWREKQGDCEAYISSSSSSLRNHSSRYLLAIVVPRAEISINKWLIFPSNSRKRLLPMILSLASCICRVIFLDFFLSVFQLPSANQSSQLTLRADDQNHSPLQGKKARLVKMQSCATTHFVCVACVFFSVFPVSFSLFLCCFPIVRTAVSPKLVSAMCAW